MAVQKTICTACSCLCDDIGLTLEDDIVTRIENACRKGASFLYGTQFEKRRNPYLVEGQVVDAEKALDRAAAELSRAKHPLIFGLDNSSLEAQAVGIELARRLRGSVDDTSSFCQGTLVDLILSEALPTCSLAELPNSDLLLYWGSNPHHSHPRHLSKFTIYAHPEYTELGAVRRVTLAAVEVRESETSVICHRVFRILPRGDKEFIGEVLKGIAGEQTNREVKSFVELLRRTRYCIVFAGLGLTYSLDNNFAPFVELARQLGKWGRLAVIPMVGHFNMRGFNHSLRKATGYVNKVGFANGTSRGDQFSLLEQVKNRSFDCLMVVGADPFSSLPRSVAVGLADVPIIAVDPFQTATTRGATVVLGTAVTGVEVGGSAVRMDGTEVALMPGRKPSRLGDEEVLRRLLEKVTA
ncbi:MAG: formylmethanofuran dehydrogenase subunit B [Chloroflexota bacterium]